MAVDLLTETHDLLIQAGVPPEIVQRIVTTVRVRWGGQQIYLPAIDRLRRDQLIQAGIQTGQPIDEIARVASCSPATIRRKRSNWL